MGGGEPETEPTEPLLDPGILQLGELLALGCCEATVNRFCISSKVHQPISG